MTPHCFVDELIVARLGTRHMVVGNDFRYGSNAGGTIETLRAAGRAHGFGVEQIAPFVFDGVRVSSTVVRERLERETSWGPRACWAAHVSHVGSGGAGAAAGAARWVSPTANLRLMRRKPPLWGILAVRACGIGPQPLPGVASLGTRPTVNGTEPLLEVHVFDYDGDLYGRSIEVEFVAKLRDEVKFDSLDAMIVQMKVDAALARDLLSKVDSG